jgi:hypothetical protein
MRWKKHCNKNCNQYIRHFDIDLNMYINWIWQHEREFLLSFLIYSSDFLDLEKNCNKYKYTRINFLWLLLNNFFVKFIWYRIPLKLWKICLKDCKDATNLSFGFKFSHINNFLCEFTIFFSRSQKPQTNQIFIFSS